MPYIFKHVQLIIYSIYWLSCSFSHFCFLLVPINAVLCIPLSSHFLKEGIFWMWSFLIFSKWKKRTTEIIKGEAKCNFLKWKICKLKFTITIQWHWNIFHFRSDYRIECENTSGSKIMIFFGKKEKNHFSIYSHLDRLSLDSFQFL